MPSPTKKQKTTAYETRLFINGEFVNSLSGKTFPCVNPTNEEVICEVQEAGEEDVEKAVSAARAAFSKGSEWRRMPSSRRRDLMLKLADLVERDHAYLAELETLNNGKPLASDRKTYGSFADIHLVVQCLRYYAGHADKLLGTTIPVDGKQLVYTVREPVGVCAGIIPFNFPLLMFAWKISPALAAGCTVIIKTSEKTPLSALAVAKLIVEAGFPKGVVNVLSGYGPTAGAALARHMDVDKIAFTGSTAVGHQVMKMAAESNLKRVTLELGGKSPIIVLDDADIDEAVAAANTGIFLNHGQCCCASSRAYVQSGVYDKFMTKMVELAKARKLGDPLTTGTEQGPLVDEIQFKKVLGFIEIGKAEGAKVMCGGKRFGDKGYFVEPTIFGDVKDDMRIAREEIFGPVISVMKFDDVEEAIERANNTMYGLAAGICSRDVGKIVRIASELRAGTVWANGSYNSLDCAQPFGGFKQSGIGRELGAAGLDNYLESKSVVIPMDR
jgi:aldehyde dehydrogenase (NAD+)